MLFRSVSRTSARNHSSTVIIAGAVGAIVALIIALLVWWRCRRRKARRARRASVDSATVCGTEDGRRPKSAMESKDRRASSRMSSPPRYDVLAPLTTVVHEQTGNRYSLVGDLPTAPRGAQNGADEDVAHGEPADGVSPVVGSDNTNMRLIRQLESEMEGLRAQRDELWQALGGPDGEDERSVSSILPSYQDVIQSRSNDAILEYTP